MVTPLQTDVLKDNFIKEQSKPKMLTTQQSRGKETKLFEHFQENMGTEARGRPTMENTMGDTSLLMSISERKGASQELVRLKAKRLCERWT